MKSIAKKIGMSVLGLFIALPSFAAEEVNVYSARHYDTDRVLYKNFEDKTGIKVNLIEGKADALMTRIVEEGQNSPADVLITVDAGRLWRAEQKGLFQSVSSDVLESSVPSNLRHPDGLWYGLSKRSRVIVYSKDRVNPQDLTSYEDLSSDKWNGKVLIRTSNNIYNQSLISSMIATHGVDKTEAWAKQFVKNFARAPKGNDTAQIKAVAGGVGDVALVNHYYVARLKSSDDPKKKEIASKVGVFFPNQGDRGAHVNICGAGVVKNAPHKENAIKFIEYLVSPEAQKIFAQGNNEYPILADVEIPEVLKGFGSFKADSVNVSEYGKNQSEAIKLMDRASWQ